MEIDIDSAMDIDIDSAVDINIDSAMDIDIDSAMDIDIDSVSANNLVKKAHVCLCFFQYRRLAVRCCRKVWQRSATLVVGESASRLCLAMVP